MLPMRAPPLPPLACRRCRICGYDLSGRPDTERCSECGASHDQNNFAVIGASHINPVAITIGISAAVIIGWMYNALSSGPIPSEFVALGAGALIAFVVLPRVRISPVLAVTPEGLFLRQGFGRAPLRRWDQIDRITLQASPHQPYRLTRTARVSIDRWQLSVHMKEPSAPGFTGQSNVMILVGARENANQLVQELERRRVMHA